MNRRRETGSLEAALEGRWLLATGGRPQCTDMGWGCKCDHGLLSNCMKTTGPKEPERNRRATRSTSRRDPY